MYLRAHIKQTTDEKDSLGCLLFCIVFLIFLVIVITEKYQFSLVKWMSKKL